MAKQAAKYSMDPTQKVMGSDVPTREQLLQQYGDTASLNAAHERIIETVLEDEERLVADHRKQIDEAVKIVKDEMTLLNAVDKAGSDVEQYAKELDAVLLSKIQKALKLREQLH